MLSVYNMTGMSSREPEIFYISAKSKRSSFTVSREEKSKAVLLRLFCISYDLIFCFRCPFSYSTVTLFARFLGRSTSSPLATDT